MDADSVLEVLDALQAASLQVWLDGGWGVDALLGEQTRPHGDLDLVAGVDDGPGLCAALAAIGFRRSPEGSETNFVLRDERGREVDVHLVHFDAHGYGSFPLPDGRAWSFPAAAFAARGRVGDREVPCLSADAQVQCHGQGYPPTEKDRRDMKRLQQRFGVVLPASLCAPPPFEIAVVRVFVHDWERAVDFYTNAVGMTLLVRKDDFGWAELEAGSCSLAVERLDRDDEEAGDLVGRFVGISLRVPDIEETHARLVERGVEFLSPPVKQPWGGVLAHLRDPEGNVITLLGAAQ
jgi:lincosamide nucleotidyltransferase A/C/D/E